MALHAQLGTNSKLAKCHDLTSQLFAQTLAKGLREYNNYSEEFKVQYTRSAVPCDKHVTKLKSSKYSIREVQYRVINMLQNLVF